MANHKQLLALLATTFGVPIVRATVQTALEAPPAAPAAGAEGKGGSIAWRILEFSDEDETLLGCYECVLALFRRARIIVGKHGAGLANMLVAAPQSAVLEIWDNFNPQCFMDLAHTLGLEYHMLVSDNGGAPLRKLGLRLRELKQRYEDAEQLAQESAALHPAQDASVTGRGADELLLRRVRAVGTLASDPPRFEELYKIEDDHAEALQDAVDRGASAEELNRLKVEHAAHLEKKTKELRGAVAVGGTLGSAALMEEEVGLGNVIVSGGGDGESASDRGGVAAATRESPQAAVVAVQETLAAAEAAVATAATNGAKEDGSHLPDVGTMKLGEKARECLARFREQKGRHDAIPNAAAARWDALNCNLFGGAFSSKAVAQDEIAFEAVDAAIAPFKGAKAGWVPVWGKGQTAVVGLAAGNFDLHTARRFVGTLRMTGYCDSIIWGVTDELDGDAREFLLENNVILANVEVGPCASDDLGKKCSAKDDKVPLALYRFDWYREQLDYLQKVVGLRDDARVLFSDSRDAFFQVRRAAAALRTVACCPRAVCVSRAHLQAVLLLFTTSDVRSF